MQINKYPILIVDDNPTNLKVLVQTLDRPEYQILVAQNGKRALEIAQQAHPALILLDIMMPGMDGFEVCQHLKSSDDTKDSAVIFLSALADVDAKIKGFALGAVDYIAKPFQAEEVNARVKTHLRLYQLEADLAERNKQLEADYSRLLSAMGEGVIGYGHNATITFMNPAGEKLTGWTTAELSGHSEWFLRDQEAGQKDDINNSLQKGEVVRIVDAQFPRKDGSVFPADFTITPIFEDGQLAGAVLVFRDISLRKSKESELEDAREKITEQREHLAHMTRLTTIGEMAAGIAHEVNQPLAAISTYAQTCIRINANDNPNTELLDEALSKIDTQSHRASQVIQKLRNFLRKPSTERETLCPHGLIDEIVTLAEVDSRVNGIELITKFDQSLPSIYIDKVQIQQVLLNLIRNGIDAMKENPGCDDIIIINAELTEDCFIEFAVSDAGGGIDEETGKQLFHPFFTTKDTGMGIGLSVCESIIHSHGGVIGHRPNQPCGTTMFFTLPSGAQDQPSEMEA